MLLLTITVFIGILLSPKAISQTHASDLVPWDSLVAEMQITDQLAVTDSLKQARLAQIFHQFGVSRDDYRRFREEMLLKSADAQRDFIQAVKAIAEGRLKEFRPKAPEGFRKPKSTLPPPRK